jgi:hypothetical protein
MTITSSVGKKYPFFWDISLQAFFLLLFFIGKI